MAPSWTYPPSSNRKFSRLRRRSPKQNRKLLGWTSNALITALISAIVSGLIAFAIAHQQTQDSAQQAASSQRTQDILRLEADIKAHYLAIIGFVNRLSSCDKNLECQLKALDKIDYPTDSELAIAIDLNNISDTELAGETETYEDEASAEFSVAIGNLGGDQSNSEDEKLDDAYRKAIARCGQLIQGQR